VSSLVVVVVSLASAVAALTVPATATPATATPATADVSAAPRVKPLVWGRDLADPSVVEVNDNYLAVGTGTTITRFRAGGARGPFKELSTPLTAYPSWVLPGELWAPDLAQVADGTWRLYFTAPTAGLAPGGRCIGVATAPTASGPFTPYGDAPLVCPPRVGWAPASDELLNRGWDLPATGVIDASLYTERDGRLYLLYKTQGKPSTIRMVLLQPDGVAVSPGSRSKQLLRTTETVENPTLVRGERYYVLFTSEGAYSNCDYRTTYRRSRKKWSWPTGSTNFLGPVLTGLCGPGGADVVAPRKGGPSRMFFHGWTCYQTAQPCPRGFRSGRDGSLLPSRAMYGLVLDFDESDRPQIADYLTPR
jgi:arabinan endo-1,5-alpha-L-arabinosidase